MSLTKLNIQDRKVPMRVRDIFLTNYAIFGFAPGSNTFKESSFHSFGMYLWLRERDHLLYSIFIGIDNTEPRNTPI